MTEEAPPQYIITSEFTSTIQPQTQLFSDDVTVENQQIRGFFRGKKICFVKMAILVVSISKVSEISQLFMFFVNILYMSLVIW